jgi:tagaturonate reductase
MNRLNKQFVLSNADLSKHISIGSLLDYPEKAIQFGEGNFLRAFVDWKINALNKNNLFGGKVVIVQPLKVGMTDELNRQDCLYTLIMRGMEGGKAVAKKEIITSVSRGIDPYANWEEFLALAENPELRFMFSNTTEAGIAYKETPLPELSCPDSFPAKVTAFLYKRFKHFQGDPAKGMVIIPCELIEKNGAELKSCILKHAKDWHLEVPFTKWINEHNSFFNTLVDRIVPGHPKDEMADITKELGYEDNMLVTSELFDLWALEGDAKHKEELPFHKAGLNVIWTDNQKPYRTLKVLILNGSHTILTIPALLAGKTTVKEIMEDPAFEKLIRRAMTQEVLPGMDFGEKEKTDYFEAVMERFRNPFIKHYLESIKLNSFSKFKVRVLPSLLKYYEMHKACPPILSLSYAALLYYYWQSLGKKNASYTIKEDDNVVSILNDVISKSNGDINTYAASVMRNTELWGLDLAALAGFEELTMKNLAALAEKGSAKAIENILAK